MADRDTGEKPQSEAETALENAVLLRMLETPPKPHEKPPESSEPRRRGRPIGGAGTGVRAPR